MNKVVDFSSQISELLSLYFYDFSIICYAFSNFTKMDLIIHVLFAFLTLKSSFEITTGFFAGFPQTGASSPVVFR